MTDGSVRAPAAGAPVSRRVRVVQFIPSLGVGGAERVMADLAIGLDPSRYEVKVLSFFDRTGTSIEKTLDVESIEIVSLGKHLGFDPSMFVRVATALRGLAPDILHTHRPVYPYSLLAVLGRLRGRVVHTVHNVAREEVQDPIRRATHWAAVRSGVAAVAICEHVADSVREYYGVEPRAVIPNGIPVARFALPPGRGRAWREANGIAASAVVVGSVARLAPQKNPLALVEAFAAVRDSPEAVLLLAGDGELRPQVEAAVRARGLGRRVRLLGTRSDIPELLAACDVVALPSLFEGNPLAVMEAMAAGRTVVASAVGGVPELIRDGQTGVLVPPGDVSALTRALRDLLTGRDARDRLGAAAAAASPAFDIARMVERYDQLYQEMLASAGTPARSPASRALASRGAPRPSRRSRCPGERKARVVQFIPSLGMGGAECMMASLATGLHPDRYEVKVLTFFDRTGSSVEEALDAGGVEIVTLGKDLGFDARMFGRVAEALQDLAPDVLHTHRPVFPYALPAVPGALRGRIVHTVHSIAQREVDGRIRRSAHWLAFRAGVAPVAICDFVAKTVQDVYGVPARATIPNGVPIARYALPPGVRERWRAALDIPSDAVVLVSVARLVDVKNPLALLEAFSAVREPKARLLFVGDGELRPEVEARTRELGLERRVRILGARRDVPEVLAASDAFVLSSRFEGSPLSVMEAMAAGVPVVATAVGGVPELVQHEVSGLVVAPEAIGELAAAVQRVAASRGLREEMGRNARRTAEERFDASHMIAAYERLYQEIVAEHRS